MLNTNLQNKKWDLNCNISNLALVTDLFILQFLVIQLSVIRTFFSGGVCKYFLAKVQWWEQTF